MNVKVGDRLREISETGSTVGIEEARKPMPCTVIYVHPLGRYYTVRFDVGYQESYRPNKGGTN